jgi:hypothetical protein
MKLKSVILYCLLLVGVTVQAQVAQINADTTELSIGEQVRINLKYHGDKSDQVHWPVFKDTLTSFLEIIDQSILDTINDGNTLTLSQDFLITSFDTGYHVVEPIVLPYRREGDSSFNFTETDPMLFAVHTVEIDTTMAIRDIKEVLDAPVTLEEVLPQSLTGIGVIAFLILAYFIIKRLMRKPELEEAEEELPQVIPHEWALENLEQVRHEKLWQQEKVKEYYTRCSDVVREYIELKFSIPALEVTTDEIVDSLKEAKINDQAIDKLFQSLSLADLVKFAKAKPMPVEHEMCLEHLVDFVNETKVVNEVNRTVTQERRRNEDL